MANLRRLPWLGILILSACSGDGTSASQRAITGRLDTAQLRLVSAQAVATGRSGRTYRAPVATDGSFRIVLPVGDQYTLRFANTTSAGRLDSFAVLAARAGERRFALTAGGTIDLGRVGMGAAASGLSAMSYGEPSEDDHAEDVDDDHGDDEPCSEEDDELEVCDVEQGGDEVEVGCEHDLYAEVDRDHDGVADADDDDDDRVACSSASGGDDCELDDDQEEELEHDDAQACAAGEAAGGTSGGAAAAEPGIQAL